MQIEIVEGSRGRSKRAALGIAFEKPDAWEHGLFGQVLSDSISAQAHARHAQRRGLVLGFGERIEAERTMDWCRSQLDDLQRIMIVTIKRLLEETLPEAFGPPGPYGDLIDWCQRIRRANLDSRFTRIAQEMSPRKRHWKARAVGPRDVAKDRRGPRGPGGRPA